MVWYNFVFFPDAIYDCSSLYSKSYRISGEYKLPKDDFLGTPELSVSATAQKKEKGPFFVVCISSRFIIYGYICIYLQVYCDMETNGGGWTVIQRRKIGLTSFNRDWKQYKTGFGSIRGDFWLGNEHIFRLTRQPSVLRIEMEVRVGNSRCRKIRKPLRCWQYCKRKMQSAQELSLCPRLQKSLSRP